MNAASETVQRVVLEHAAGKRRVWLTWLLVFALSVSLITNVVLYVACRDYYALAAVPLERFHSGDSGATDRIALLRLSGTVTPPFTGRLLRQIEKATDDDDVKGAILVIDSPGGFVADSHQIYTELKKLSKTKPVYVAMKRMAASGGYYIAMGAGPEGRIFAEPTTWTGSIGVIIPRYNASELAEKVGVRLEPLMTGPFKDTLSPFRDMTEEEKRVWREIIDDAYERFVGVIDENRPGLDRAELTELATGQIFTATQAEQNGLVDEIGFLEDAISALQEKLDLRRVRVVTYYTRPSLAEMVTGISATTRQPDPLATLLEASVPQALYLCSWGAPVPAPR